MVQQVKDHARPLWTWRELQHALDLSASNGPDIHRVHADSRTTEKGDLFVALPGDPGPRFNASYRSTVDGHDFVADAAARGASGAMLHRTVSVEMPTLIIGDTYDGLWSLGRAAAQRMDGLRLAITGSSGKTTAKTFLAAALDAFSAPGSFNNHLGVPLSLANMPSASTFGVFEIGTNHSGEIRPLAELVEPEIAIVLNIGVAHLENFAGPAALRQEKLSIFDVLKDRSKAISEQSLQVEFGVCFGRQRGADAWLKAVEGDMATVQLFGERLQARIPGGGEHRAMTLVATMLAVKLAEGDVQRACDLSPTLVPEGRGNEHLAGGVSIVDDSYNANPVSMAAAITALQASGAQRRIAVLGEMLELGEDAPAAHARMLELAGGLEVVICVGENFRESAANSGVVWYPDAGQDLQARLLAMAQSGDRMLVKGSNKVFWQQGFVRDLVQYLQSE